jgi:hypothetical protein
VQTTALPFAIILERHDPARYMTRYYTLALERHLCGEWSLVRMWGRIGQTRITLCVDLPTNPERLRQKAT